MKIAFSRINTTAYPFKLNFENMLFEGVMFKVNPKLVEIQALMQGVIYRPCDSCGEELELCVKENLKLFASDGIFKDEPNILSDVVEFFDGQIDLLALTMSEFESYLSDYFYCNDCKD